MQCKGFSIEPLLSARSTCFAFMIGKKTTLTKWEKKIVVNTKWITIYKQISVKQDVSVKRSGWDVMGNTNVFLEAYWITYKTSNNENSN